MIFKKIVLILIHLANTIIIRTKCTTGLKKKAAYLLFYDKKKMWNKWNKYWVDFVTEKIKIYRWYTEM